MEGSLESLLDDLKSDSKSASSLRACLASSAKLDGWKDFGVVRKVRITESALSTINRD